MAKTAKPVGRPCYTPYGDEFCPIKLQEVYLMEAKISEIVNKRFIKIGVSVRPATRVKEIQTGCPFPIEVLMTTRRNLRAPDAEAFLHEKLKDYRTCGEWFALPSDQMNTLINFMECFMDWPRQWDKVWRNCHWDFAPIAQHPPVTVGEAVLIKWREDMDDGAPRKNAA